MSQRDGRLSAPRDTDGAGSREGLWSGARQRWLRSLQGVSIRTKIVVPMVVLAVVPTTLVGAFTISRTRDLMRENAVQAMEFDAVSRASAVGEFLRSARLDVQYISGASATRRFVDEALASSGGPTSASLDALGEIGAFFRARNSYCQVECRADSGVELFRLDDPPGVPIRSTDSGNGERPADARPRDLRPGVTISTGTAEGVHGDRTMGPQPVLRFAAPIPGPEASADAGLTVHVCPTHVLSMLQPLPTGAEAWLLDGTGAYIGYAGTSADGARRFRVGSGRTVSDDFAADDAKRLLHPAARTAIIETEESFLVPMPVPGVTADDPFAWTLVISRPRAPMEALVRDLTILLSAVVLLVVAVSVAAGVFVGHYLSRPIAALRRATQRIAAGDPSRRLSIATGDEIEALASDFNSMADEVRAAQDRLREWNERLQTEVDRRTEDLRATQRGLARAEKLASLGQMTAGVMHEIGNPLAAMKTRIQVAQEEPEACSECRALGNEIVFEVDRLSAFLRSVSRYTRLSQLSFTDVALPDLVGDTVRLLRPELGRRNIDLRVDVAPGVPNVRADPNYLRQVLVNLVLNAAEASEDGSDVVVSLANDSAEGVSLSVTDHGHGVPAAIRDQIWNQFFTTKADGTGLGLSICRQIVNGHGGTIELTSAADEGTTVSVTLPGVSRPDQGTGDARSTAQHRGESES